MRRGLPALLFLLAACSRPADRPPADASDTLSLAARPRGFALSTGDTTSRFAVRLGNSILVGRVTIDSAVPMVIPPPLPDPSPDIPPDTVTKPVALGAPFGPMSWMQGASWRWNRKDQPFSLNLSAVDPPYIIQQIATARAARVRLILVMTGGSHNQYLMDGKFYLPAWKARQQLFATPAIKAAIAQGVTDSTVRGANLMDEPDHPTWGGVMTKAKLDEMALFTKAIFPTLPVGATIVPEWRPLEKYQRLDFIIPQYSPKFANRSGWQTAESFRALASAAARLNGVALLPSLNVVDWIRARTSGIPCPVPETGGVGSVSGDVGVKGCRITALQLETEAPNFGLMPEACGLLMWKYDTLMFDQPPYRAAAQKVAAALATRPMRSCRRS